MALNVYRDRSVARINANGEPVNVYLMKMTNKTQQPQTYRLTVASDTSLQLSKIYELKLIAGERVELPIAVTLKHQDPIFGVDQQSRTTSGHITFEFEMTNIHQPEQHLRQSASFIYQAQ
jgi:hypothetical protein